MADGNPLTAPRPRGLSMSWRGGLQCARVHCVTLPSPLLGGFLFGRLGLGHVPPGKAAADGPQHGVVPGIVAGHSAHRRPLDAPLGAGRARGGGQQNGQAAGDQSG